jgi:uncharacterized integral membrane protein
MGTAAGRILVMKKMSKVRLAAILCLAVVLITITIQNRGPVQTRLLFVTVEMPQILLLLLMAGGGFCLGLLVALFVGSRNKAQKENEVG